MLSAGIDSNYFRDYRKQLGFTRQQDLKDFFTVKGVPAHIDFQYLDDLNGRLLEIISKIDSVVPVSIKYGNMDEFNNKFITNAYNLIKDNEILPE
jgi:hypothetical protein